MADWTNSDGLLVRFGASQGTRGARGAVTEGAGKRREFVATVTLTGAARTIYTADPGNTGTNTAFNGLDTAIPTGAVLVNQTVEVIETPAGGTNYIVGTYGVNGTAVDDDGIRVTAGTNGALIGTQVAADTYVAVKTTGTYTAGIIKVIVEYMYR